MYWCNFSTKRSQNNVMFVSNKILIHTQHTERCEFPSSSDLWISKRLGLTVSSSRGKRRSKCIIVRLSLITFSQVSSCTQHSSDDKIQSRSPQEKYSKFTQTRDVDSGPIPCYTESFQSRYPIKI